MIGLFEVGAHRNTSLVDKSGMERLTYEQELGPCKFPVGASTPVPNSYSWNEYANMLFVDQPTGSGFSYGSETVNSTAAAAPFVWTLLQAFFANFPQYKKRELSLFTESYGGHYGPGK